MDSQTRPKYMVRQQIETSAIIPNTQPFFEIPPHPDLVKVVRAVADALGVKIEIPGELRPVA